MNRVLPILFNTDMVRAILEDRKTTRYQNHISRKEVVCDVKFRGT